MDSMSMDYITSVVNLTLLVSASMNYNMTGMNLNESIGMVSISMSMSYCMKGMNSIVSTGVISMGMNYSMTGMN